MNTIVKIQSGSFLYGTNGPNSDTDILGVYVPDLYDVVNNQYQKVIVTNTNPNNKNGKDDVDSSFHSIQHYIGLLLKGQTVAIDLLFSYTNIDAYLHRSDTWQYIIDNKDKAITKNINAFVGYCNQQARKYGDKGTRLNIYKEMLNIIKKNIITGKETINDILNNINMLKQILKYDQYNFVTNEWNKQRVLHIIGAKFNDISPLIYVYEQLQLKIEQYGNRAEKACEDNGLDSKALYNAFRVMFEVQSLLKDQVVTFPLKEASFLKYIKYNQHDYTKEQLSEMIDQQLKITNQLYNQSKLPLEPDYKFWKDFLYSLYKG